MGGINDGLGNQVPATHIGSYDFYSSQALTIAEHLRSEKKKKKILSLSIFCLSIKLIF